MRRTSFVLVFAMLSGCRGKPAAEQVASAASPPAAPLVATTRASAVASATSHEKPGLLRIDPVVPPFEFGIMDHASEMGWSKDGSRFGSCFVSGGSGGTRCAFEKLDGTYDSFDDASPGGEPDDRRTRALDARVASLSLTKARVRWIYGGEIAVVWKAIPGDIEHRRSAVLKVGARVDGEAPSFPLALSDHVYPGSYDVIHPELIAMSPDGSRLGVVAHTFGGEFSDTFPIAITDTHELAGHAYNDAGFARHKKGEYAKAAELFEKAVLADGNARLPRYNLACAYARLGDSRVRATLEAAIVHDLDAKRKAGTDADFDSVRGAPWFIDLVK